MDDTDQDLRYVVVFHSEVLDLPDSLPTCAVQVSAQTNLRFTRGPIELPVWHCSFHPVQRMRDGVLVGNQDLFRAVPGGIRFPERHAYVVTDTNIPQDAENDVLQREIGFAVTLLALLIGSSHLVHCVWEGWVFFPDRGRFGWTVRGAEVVDFDPRDFARKCKLAGKHVSGIDSESWDRILLMARWFSKAVRESEDTEDRFMYYWTVIEILLDDKKPLVRHLLYYLADNILLGRDKQNANDIDEIKTRLEIGQLYGTRRDLYHRGRLAWEISERGRKFKLLDQLCSEMLRHELGFPLTRCLESYMS